MSKRYYAAGYNVMLVLYVDRTPANSIAKTGAEIEGRALNIEAALHKKTFVKPISTEWGPSTGRTTDKENLGNMKFGVVYCAVKVTDARYKRLQRVFKKKKCRNFETRNLLDFFP